MFKIQSLKQGRPLAAPHPPTKHTCTQNFPLALGSKKMNQQDALLILSESEYSDVTNVKKMLATFSCDFILWMMLSHQARIVVS